MEATTDFDIDYSSLPEHLRKGAQRYIEHGVMPGDFLQAVIRLDLLGAHSFADPVSAAYIHDVIRFFHDSIPMRATGSQAAIDYWTDAGGLKGGANA